VNSTALIEDYVYLLLDHISFDSLRGVRSPIFWKNRGSGQPIKIRVGVTELSLWRLLGDLKTFSNLSALCPLPSAFWHTYNQSNTTIERGEKFFNFLK
jgi:hypothetical protein